MIVFPILVVITNIFVGITAALYGDPETAVLTGVIALMFAALAVSEYRSRGRFRRHRAALREADRIIESWPVPGGDAAPVSPSTPKGTRP